MRRISPIVCLALMSSSLLLAEGTREMAPNGSITVNGNATTDVAALHINNPNYNSFAAYDNPDPQSRLYIHVLDPAKECLLVGFSYAHANSNVPNPPRETFEFRIKDPEGNVVFGPMTVDPVDVNINSWSEGFNGPAQLFGVNGYDAIEITSAMLTSQGNTAKGDYYIEFRNEANDDLLIDF